MGFHATDKDVPAWKDPPQTLQERLRELARWFCVEGYDANSALIEEAADALDIQSQLLAEAREALEQVAAWWDEDGPHRTEPDLVTAARAVLAKFKAATEGV